MSGHEGIIASTCLILNWSPRVLHPSLTIFIFPTTQNGKAVQWINCINSCYSKQDAKHPSLCWTNSWIFSDNKTNKGLKHWTHQFVKLKRGHLVSFPPKLVTCGRHPLTFKKIFANNTIQQVWVCCVYFVANCTWQGYQNVVLLRNWTFHRKDKHFFHLIKTIMLYDCNS